MRYLLILILSVSCIAAQSQQINPVPDYIFRNQMSVGRNTFTDTAAYMSIGPRYGAVKGFMPPIVTDTNAVTGVKRNGLLIFSIQLNNFAYWDSTTARFRKITAEASVDSLIFATRAYRQKGDDSLGAIIAVKTDTGLISTKAYRQKGIDSVVTLISTLGGGTVLSVSAGTGMNFSTITTSGAVNADTLVLSTRAWRQKAVDSLGGIATTKLSISDTATMLGAYLRKADTTAMLTPYLRKVDTTAMLTPYVRAAGYGLVKGTQTLSTDTAAMATRSRVQKGLDSVAALVAAPDSLIFSTRAWRQKGDDSLGVIIGTKATATGTTNYLSKFTGTSALGNSIVYATTSEVGISTPSPTHTLDVNGRTRIRTIDSTGTGMNMLYSDADGVIKKAAIPAGGSGTVTSVATGFGLSGGTITTTGTLLVDSASIATRSRAQKGIDSLGAVKQNVITNPVTGTGTTNYVSKWTGTSTQAISQIFDNGTNVGIGTTTPSAKLDVRGGRFYAINESAPLEARYSDVALFGAGTTLLQLGVSIFPSATESLRRVELQPADGGNFRNLYLNPQGGNVAIGSTSTPAYKLDITGTLRNTTGAAFATSSGNVLIGTTTDGGSYKLDVQGALRNTTNVNLATGGGGLRIGDATTSATRLDVVGGALTSTSTFSHTGANGGINISNIGTLAANRDAQFRLSNGTTFFGASDASYQIINIGRSVTDAAFDIQHYAKSTYTRRLRIDTTGNLGVGDITTPTERLHVSGRIRATTIDSTATGMNMLYADATGVIKKAAVPSGGITGTGITGYFPKWTGTATQDTSQLFQLGRNIGIGTATPTYRLHLPDAGNTASQAMLAGTIFGSDGNGQTIVPGGNAMTLYGQGSDGYLYGAQVSGGKWGVNTRSLGDATFNVNGSVKIVTVDSTSTARNMLYADANGVIKKSAALSMSDDVMTASGSWVVTKDAGSGYSINNVAYTTNGTTKMVTIDGAFYIGEESFSDAAWNDVATIPAGFRPQKTVNWTNNFIVTGAEYETSGGTDFTGALQWTYAQMRVTDEGKVQINGSINTNTLDAGGGGYVVIQFTQTYIIK
jgi:hypothetical protein